MGFSNSCHKTQCPLRRCFWWRSRWISTYAVTRPAKHSKLDKTQAHPKHRSVEGSHAMRMNIFFSPPPQEAHHHQPKKDRRQLPNKKNNLKTKVRHAQSLRTIHIRPEYASYHVTYLEVLPSHNRKKGTAGYFEIFKLTMMCMISFPSFCSTFLEPSMPIRRTHFLAAW